MIDDMAVYIANLGKYNEGYARYLINAGRSATSMVATDSVFLF